VTLETPVAARQDEDERPENAVIVITDPRDGSLVGELPAAGPEQAQAAVETARAAFGSWRRTPAEERGHALRRAADALEQRADEVRDLEMRETGRLHADVEGGIGAAVATLRQYAELGPVHRGRSLLGAPDATDLLRPEPRGVVAVITPWNDPVAICAGLIGAALVTGNTVVHKPSERCPHLGRLLGEILAPCLPDGVLTTVVGGPEAGQALASSPDVDMVAHVGSSRTGEWIAGAVARTGAHLIRENGGNDPLIVDAGVDPAWAAAQIARGAFANSGQLCTAVERVFLHRNVADQVIAALVAEAEARSQAMAPLVDERMREHVHAHVLDALASGARALTGARIPDGPGSAYPPTVLVDCTPDMLVMHEETFGPVAPIMVADDFDAALALAADDEHGLAATVLTADIAHAHAAIDALAVGTVKVNDVFGGGPGGSAEPRGRSGAGFGFGPELLDEMTTVKAVHLGSAVTR